MRLIDANALIREAKRRNETYNLRGLSKAISDIVKDMTTYAPCPYEMRWIPCSERMPVIREYDHCGDILHVSDNVLFCDQAGVYIGYREKTSSGKLIWQTEDGHTYNDVTAWMPLPEAYKED